MTQSPPPSTPDATRVVICMKWGTLFPADYVNVLYTACRRHITGAFRFVCLTDDPAGLRDGVEAYPIPDLGLTQAMWKHGGWPKLAVFLPDLYGLSGRALFIDLDMVICGPLDGFFDHPQPFVTTDMGEGWRATPRPGPPEPGTCIFAFQLGAEPQILAQFLADKAAAIGSVVNEQAWVGVTARSMAYWPEGWVISFKRFLRQPLGRDLFLGPKPPPASARVIAFHGDPRPIALLRPGNRRWDSFPHMGHGQVGWMAKYWLENGGSLPRG